MKNEISRILKMMEEGKIDADKASELINLLKQEPHQEEEKGHNKRDTHYLDKTLKIVVISESNDNVKVNLPLRLVKIALATGQSIAASIPQSAQYVKDIDIDLILDAIENELDGQIVDITTAEGDQINIFIA
ncbi:hypothetical protein ACFFIS_05605 [Virgibacillus soli]|uniref:YvlB/LiaX N-terminal domain-containing protein n=1 Tax=Paracerasibacillus soli TaxID=480284 RepID=A0ABU5CTG0_9BACI|nr:hypothetical protein [Virgibacillus soli]MDY0409668.1 hypothetical protein [Virgibacillus soli]